MPIKRPAGLSREAEQRLPRWLREACRTEDEGKLVSDRFLAIEKDEQRRMQQALSGKVSYGSPSSEAPKPVQIAGIEKGSKNRYPNIFPYDHSRVRLQGEPAEGCDYVNANYVKASVLDQQYIATQAPTGSNRQQWQWLIVTDKDKRAFIGECYRKSWYTYASGPRPDYAPDDPRAAQQPQQLRGRFVRRDDVGEVHGNIIGKMAVTGD